ncbi:MAG: phosphoenolpyruvate carboxylase, partial [Gammaproteobacteria bacterium]
MAKRSIHFPSKDEPLREDVSALGTLVGAILREQGGPSLFENVEAARLAAIRRREGNRNAEQELLELVGNLTPHDATELVRAFASYFQVVNLAERVHRIRRSRDYDREGGGPQPESLEDAILKLKEAGLTPGDVAPLVADMRIEPVFTAHPTEATRRSILEKQQHIARRLVDRLDPSMTPLERDTALARIRSEVTSGWQTEEHPSARPSVADEREHVLFYVTDILYRIAPAFYETLQRALERVYGDEGGNIRMPTILRLGSWVGGDMDGNPNVDADTIRESLVEQRAMILRLYRRELTTLYRTLSQSLSRVSVDEALLARIHEYDDRFPDVRSDLPARHRDMPYRVILRFVRHRLRATARDTDGAYASADEFRADLEMVHASLCNNRGEHAGAFQVQRLLRRAHTFGFHLATLDVRQDSLVHRRVMGRLLDDPDWLERTPAERTDRLRELLVGGAACPESSDAEVRHTLEVFRAIAEGRARYGAHAFGPYIISMARAADDVLTVLLLARWGGLTGEDESIPVDVAPLFETVADLSEGPDVMRELFRDEFYREHLRSRRERQVVMLGYSDSNKDGGIAASRWAVQRAQAELVAVCRAASVRMTLFHGRGGTTSRGGGKTHHALLAAPAGAVAGRLRVTEQGEMINAKYGLRGIAMRSLEQMTGAVMMATALPPRENARAEQWRRIMEVVASESRSAYRKLVYDDPRFNDYFRQATPIDVIERMAIGSRPSARRSQTGIEDLRAIPWVFAWTQSRHILTGWYGVGTGLAAAVERFGEEEVRDMVRQWPFMGTLLDDVEMVLAKSDMPIAERYAGLADPSLRYIFEQIRDEFALTEQWVFRLKGTEALLDDDPTLQRAIRLRNPYVDPMSLLQVQLLT